MCISQFTNAIVTKTQKKRKKNLKQFEQIYCAIHNYYLIVTKFHTILKLTMGQIVLNFKKKKIEI